MPFFMRKMKGILPDDGRHDEEKKGFIQTSEWCERCRKECPLGSTRFYEELCRWMCLKCVKEVRAGKPLYIEEDGI
tara:strand:- start:214 stop:441 length:228 start_codon:yes stop_codon:yes gene_type:complete